LPGGGAANHESRTQAAIRELREETNLKPLYAKFLFRHLGRVLKSHGHGYFQDHHTVVLVEAIGTPRPSHKIKYIDFYKQGSNICLSVVTKEIIDKYYDWKTTSRGESEW
jgi:8-oxo-dGTP diphosphatase